MLTSVAIIHAGPWPSARTSVCRRLSRAEMMKRERGIGCQATNDVLAIANPLLLAMNIQERHTQPETVRSMLVIIKHYYRLLST